jgi:undecaprenyl-diphosphatase
MTVFQAIVLGLVQGLSEFLPISSSAHLALTPWLLGWEPPGLAFDVALHIGTIVAVLWYFRAEWRKLVAAAFEIARTRRVAGAEQWRVILLVLATIPAAVGGFLLQDLAETAFRAPIITAIMLIVMGVLLWAVDHYVPKRRALDELTWLDAVLIGVAQVVALVPGVSRSGATITAGRALRLDRQAAAVFSFLMSMPITIGAAIVKVPDAIAERGIGAPLVAGIAASAISGWLAISVLLRYVATNNYSLFAVYRVMLGIVVIWLLVQRGFTF